MTVLRSSSRLPRHFCVPLLIAGFALAARARGANEAVVFQMPYSDQFQFAGIYAAQAKGFFAAHGLDVRIVPDRENEVAFEEVEAGRAQYSLAIGPRLLTERLHGHDLIAIAAIMQHSPIVLLTRSEDNIRSPQDLVGKRVALDELAESSELRIMLEREGVAIDSLRVVPNRYGVNELAEGTADAMSSFVNDQPYVIRKSGMSLNVLRPIDYGVDYYGDTLFTSGREFAQHRDRALAMRDAVIEGWTYALAHPDEMIDWIMHHAPNRTPGVDVGEMQYENRELKRLINADLVKLGHLNPGRWLAMAQDIKTFDPTADLSRLDGFLYVEAPDEAHWGQLLTWLGIAFVCVGVIAIIAIVIARRMQKLVAERTAELETVLRGRYDALARINDNLPNSVVFQMDALADGTMKYVYVGSKVTKLWGVTPDELMANPNAIRDLVDGKDQRLFDEAREMDRVSLTPSDFVVRLRRPDGALRWMRVAKSATKESNGHITIFGILSDITEAQLLEEQTRQSDKLNSIGRLSSGIAHDFNNLLTIITGNVGLMEIEEGINPTLAGYIDDVKEAAQRASALTRQLLMFSRRQPMTPTVVNLNEVVNSITKILLRLLGESVIVDLKFWPRELWVDADASMLGQVIINLAVNARDAMDGAGQLVLETTQIIFDESTRTQAAGSRPGTFNVISVTDTGCGIEPDQMEKIFEPFYTTKDVGKGTGLGLATVYGIVKQHNGWINVYSEPGRGSTFRVYLPAEESGTVKSVEPGADILRGRGERILLVEDEAAVRKMAVTLLTQHGYEVVDAPTGRQALELWRAAKGRFSLLLTDMMMPEGVSGKELADAIWKEEPGMKVVYMTGYSALLAHGGANDGGTLLAKPFERSALLRTIRRKLDNE